MNNNSELSVDENVHSFAKEHNDALATTIKTTIKDQKTTGK